MKKILAIILVLCTLCLTSCSLFVIEREGLEAFGEGSSDMSLCQEVIPPGMISKFEYCDGNHFFLEKYPLTKYEVHKVLLYLTYDADVYAEAKAFVNVNLHLVERSDETESNYVFFDNYGYEKYYTEGRGMLCEEHSVAPYFIKEDQKTVYVNPLQVTIIEEINGKVMLRIEYERRLREVIREKCVTCDHFKGDPDNLDGHYDTLRLDGYCWRYENTSEDEE